MFASENPSCLSRIMDFSQERWRITARNMGATLIISLPCPSRAICYHVALNVLSTAPRGDEPACLQFQVRDDLAGSWRSWQRASLITATSFCAIRTHRTRAWTICATASSNMAKFTLPAARTGPQSLPVAACRHPAAKAKGNAKAFVAVFGTGYPDQGRPPPGPQPESVARRRGILGIDNVHMNQGNRYRVGHPTPIRRRRKPASIRTARSSSSSPINPCRRILRKI